MRFLNRTEKEEGGTFRACHKPYGSLAAVWSLDRRKLGPCHTPFWNREPTVRHSFNAPIKCADQMRSNALGLNAHLRACRWGK